MANILIEGFNLTLQKGTGIKTYARALADVARALGYETDVLLQSSLRLNRRDPVLAEIAFYEGVERRNWKDRFIRGPIETMIGAPTGVKAQRLGRTGVVVSSEDQLDQFRHKYVAHQFTVSARRHFRRHGALASLRLPERPDIFHATHLVPLQVRGAPNLYTVHDVIPLRLPSATLDNKKYFLNALREICRTADRIVTVSECSKRDIMQLVPIKEERIAVTYQSVSLPQSLVDRGTDETANILANIYNLDFGEYFLFFGAVEPKKNVARLIDAYAASGVKAPLVIAGGLGWSFKAEVDKIEQENFSSWRIEDSTIRLERRVRRLDHVSLSHLVALIRGARGVLFPSLYEGFGLPVLEAMMLGVPVMTSNTSSLPEVAGEAALLIDPYDVGSMTKAIVQLDRDADLRSELSRRGPVQAEKFSMQTYTQRVGELYRSVQ